MDEETLEVFNQELDRLKSHLVYF